MRFRDKVALISGAGSGIGRATAQMIGAKGGTVVGVDLDQAAVEQIIAQPEDQAGVICFLASADADFVTGVTIDVTECGMTGGAPRC